MHVFWCSSELQMSKTFQQQKKAAEKRCFCKCCSGKIDLLLTMQFEMHINRMNYHHTRTGYILIDPMSALQYYAFQKYALN